jgi:lipopolysaccharide transport system ATP-binding protein
MEELRTSGTTLIFVSHNMYQVRRLCKRALLLVDGKARYLGDVGEAISEYERSFHSAPQDVTEETNLGEADGQATIIISDIALLDSGGQPTTRLRYDQALTLRIIYRTLRPIVDPVIRIRIVRADNTVCVMTASAYEHNLSWTLAGEGTIEVRFQPLQLAAGRYLVDLRILDSMDSMLLVGGQSGWFDVDDPTFGHEPQRGVFVPNTHWSHKSGVPIHDSAGKRTETDAETYTPSK